MMDDPEDDLDLFLWQGQIWSLRLLNGKSKKKCIFLLYCALWYKNAFKFNPQETLEVKVI